MQNNPRKRKSSLPSPPSSEPVCETKRRISPPDGRGSRDRQSKSQCPPIFDQLQLSSGNKRRRTAEEAVFEQSHESCLKRNKEASEKGSRQESDISKGDAEEQDPIQAWARTGNWPTNFGDMSEPESESSNKRRRSTQSYSSRERDGSVPPAHTAAYEEELQRYGIVFEDYGAKDLPNAESGKLCQDLLGLEGLTPAYNSCSEETYMGVFQRATKCNEERVRRDLTPHIVPSAELLYILNGDTALKNIREEMSVDWTKCSLLGGTQPRPDYAYGLSSATFTEEERFKMENYTSIDNPTKFTASMYFPFLVCEAKCGRKNINDADRQNVHSASIAVNAIVQLCRAGGEEQAQSLSGQILVFSISHDNERVKIYGHFPLIRDGRPRFYRHYIDNYSLDGHHGRDRNTGSNFTRAVYSRFYPKHLKRIQQAIACLPDPRKTSMVSDVSVGGDETLASEQSSQERDSSRPPLRQAKSRGSQGELTLMKQQMAKMEKMHNAQLEQQRGDSQKQMEQQREDSRKQIEQQQKQMEQQQKQMEQQQKQMEQQQKQMEQQGEDSQKQIALLQTLLSRGQGA